jgi:hypothetical protein
MKRKIIAIIGLGLIAGTIYFITTQLSTNFSGRSPEANIEAPQYPVNENGQTYAEGPFPAGKDQEPYLIKAIGENGVVGYIKNSDVTPSFSSPEEAIAHQKVIEEIGYQSIPLYESDGTTVIGEYKQYPSRNEQ